MSATIGQSEAQVVPGLRERQREARDEAILENAYALMEEHGYEAMTMDDLADRVGISKRTLYHHFSSKEAIVVRAAVVLVNAAVDQLESISVGHTAFDHLDSVLRWMVGTKLSPPKGPLAYLKAQPTLMSAVRTNPEYKAAIREYLDAFARIVTDAQRDGYVNPGLDAAVVAQMIFGFIRGADFEDVLAEGSYSVKELVDMLVGSLMNGIMSKTLHPSEGKN